MLFAKLGHFATWFATVILQIQDLFCFLERHAQRLRLLNKSDATNRLRRVESIICRGTFRLRQQLKSLIIMQRLQTDPGRLGSRANPHRFLTLRRFRDHHICLKDRVTGAPRHLKFHFAVSEKLCCPCPRGPWKEILPFQSPDMSILILARYRPGVFVRSIVPPECICIPGMFMSISNFTLPTSTSWPLRSRNSIITSLLPWRSPPARA